MNRPFQVAWAVNWICCDGVLKLVLAFILLGPNLLHAQVRLPELQELQAPASRDVPAGSMLRLPFVLRDGTTPASELEFVFRTPQGGDIWLKTTIPRGGSLTQPVTPEWASGTYALTFIFLREPWGRVLTYSADGSVRATLATGEPIVLPAISATHGLDFSNFSFSVSGGSTAPVAPQLTLIERVGATTLGPGENANVGYALVAGTSQVAEMKLRFTYPPPGGSGTLPAFEIVVPRPSATGLITLPIGSDSSNGVFTLQQIEVTDAMGRLVRYLSGANGGSMFVFGFTSNSSQRHALDMRAVNFTITGAAARPNAAGLRDVSRGSEPTLAPGQSFRLDFAHGDGLSAVRAVELGLRGPFGVRRSFSVAADARSISVPVQSDWINGRYEIVGLSVTDSRDRVLTYGRGTVSSSWSVVLPPALPLQNFDFDVIEGMIVPPIFTLQPTAALTLPPQRSVDLRVEAMGAGPVTYQWYRGEPGDTSNPVVGATSTSFRFTTSESVVYWVRATAGGTSANSAPARITLIGLPVITLQPVSQVVPVGGTATFRIEATGLGTLGYQWLIGNPLRALVGNGPTLTLPNVNVDLADVIACQVSNEAGQTRSAYAFLTVRVSDQPLVITTQPADTPVVPGVSAQLVVTATGNPPLRYQWLKDGAEVAGATGSTLRFNSVVAADAGSYQVRITNGAEIVTSRVAAFSMSALPLIVRMPQEQIAIFTGQPFYLEVDVAGNGPFTYQWRKDGRPIPGATARGYLMPVQSANESGSYDVQVSNAAGTTTSRPIQITVNLAPVAPRIVRSPATQTLRTGDTLTLTVEAEGSALEYLWFKDGQQIPGATRASHTVASVVASDSGGYLAFARNSVSTALSQTATVTVVSPRQAPVITLQPQSLALNRSEPFLLTVAVDGALPLRYQWRHNGQPLQQVAPGFQQTTLSRGGMDTALVGEYEVTISNAAGSVTSRVATVTLAGSANPGRLANLSVRAPVDGSAGPLIVGFTLGGQNTGGSVSLLVRAAGPALAAFGLTGTLPDPLLRVFSGEVQVFQNDDWQDGPDRDGSLSARVGAFPFPRTSLRDSALVFSADGRGYTVHVSDARRSSGTVLAEIYHAPLDYTERTPRLINLSVLAATDAVAPLTAGFVIAGSTARTVLVRGVGPGLAAFNINGWVADPRLELFRGSTGLRTNDDWGGGVELTEAFRATGAFALPTASKDAAFLLTLEPGAYSVQLMNAENRAGVALIEVYEVR